MENTCKQCGNTFEITESEAAFYEGKGLSLPKRCPDCRKKNRKAKREKYKQYKAARNNGNQNTGAAGNNAQNNPKDYGKNNINREHAAGEKPGIVDTAAARAESYLEEQKAAKAQKGKRRLWVICAAAVIVVAFLLYTALK